MRLPPSDATARRRRLLAGACGIAAGLLFASGAAAQGVGTYVNEYSGLSGNRNFAGYNFVTDSQFNVFGPGTGGYSEYVACRADVPCATTRNGTQTVGALSSFNTATMSDTDQGGFSSGSGSARADLASGELGASAEGTYRSAFGVGSGIGTRSFATFGDSLVFAISDVTPQTITNITVNLMLEGSMSRSNPEGSGTARSYLYFGGATFDANIGYKPQTGIFGLYASNASGWDSYTITQVDQGFLFSGVFGLHGASSGLDVGEFLDLQCGNGATCDYANTAALSFDLPDNVTFTSKSGVFLTAIDAPTGGIPEPGAWALMIVGFGAAGTALRRRARPAIAG